MGRICSTFLSSRGFVFSENLLMRGACFIVVALLVLALLVELSVQQDDSLNSCERKTSCKKCIEKSTCVWCADRKKCEKGNAFGGAGCSDYHWGQCSMPQAIIIVLCILGCCCCLCLPIVLWAFRGVCCPKSWQSKLPKWDKKMRFKAERDLHEMEARPNPVTGETTRETRDKLRDKYASMGMRLK